MSTRTGRRAVLSVGESLAGAGGAARVAVTQREILREFGFDPVAVTPDSVPKHWRCARYPALNAALLSWQVSQVARREAHSGAVLFSHGMCGARGGSGPVVQLHHGTFRGLAQACQMRLSRRELLIMRGLNGWMERLSSRTSTNVVVSGAVAGEVERLYGVRNPQVIYNAVDADHFAAGERAIGERDGSVFTGLCVGRMDYGKGRDTVHRMGALLPAEYRLDLVAPHIQGDASWPDNRMRALGRVEYPQLPAVYASCDYVLVASRYEGFGLTLIEAWASGRPVVCTNVGVVPELRREEPSLDALVVDDPDDASGFADRVRLLRENPELGRRQVEWGRQVVAERFSLSAYRTAWQQLLQRASLLH